MFKNEQAIFIIDTFCLYGVSYTTAHVLLNLLTN